MANCAGCDAPEAKLTCPNCAAAGLPQVFFCGQECFKKNWKEHKKVHSAPAPCNRDSMTAEMLANYEFSGKLRPAKLSAKRSVKKSIPRPDYADRPDGRSDSEEKDSRTQRKEYYGCDEATLQNMRRCCKVAREVLDVAGKAVRPGITTDELDRIVHEASVERDAYPSPLNYNNFPKSVCTSVNEIICHGIPDSRELQEGDIVNLDVTCYRDGVHGDLNETFFVGRPAPEALHLVKTAYECLMAGLNTCKPGSLYRNVGAAVEAKATAGNLSVVRNYCGHGIHKLFHTTPNIPHYAKNKTIGAMKPGHIFTLEPMINQGCWQDILWPDHWTAATADGKWSAQFEQTVVIRPKGLEILTGRPDNAPPGFVEQLNNWGIECKLDIPDMANVVDFFPVVDV